MPIALPIILCLAVSGPTSVSEFDGMDQATIRLRSSAELGELRAMRELATRLLASREQSHELEAADWLAEAASSGDPEAMHQLACVWFAGRGVERDRREAVALWQAAAASGHPDAMYDLAVCYRDGRGIFKSEIRSSLWFRRAAQAGRPEAMEAWGKCLFDGIGTRMDESAAID